MREVHRVRITALVELAQLVEDVLVDAVVDKLLPAERAEERERAGRSVESECVARLAFEAL